MALFGILKTQNLDFWSKFGQKKLLRIFFGKKKLIFGKFLQVSIEDSVFLGQLEVVSEVELVRPRDASQNGSIFRDFWKFTQGGPYEK